MHTKTSQTQKLVEFQQLIKIQVQKSYSRKEAEKPRNRSNSKVDDQVQSI